MSNSEQYWKNRIEQGQKKAEKINDTFIKRQQRMYKKSYKTILNYLNDLLVDIEQGNEITRTQLYTAKKYIKLIEMVDKSATLIHNQQVKDLEKAINDAYHIKIGTAPSKINHFHTSVEFNGAHIKQQEQILNIYWSGKSFKERVGINANQFAGRVRDKITDAIILGKNPDSIKKELMKEFDIAFNVADRLVRTETAYAFNQASLNQYKEEGLNKVRILVENDACEVCEEYKGQEYILGAEPFLPAHPNCKCAYAPVIDIVRKAETK